MGSKLVEEIILNFLSNIERSTWVTEHSIPQSTKSLDPQSTNVRRLGVTYCSGISSVLEGTPNFRPGTIER
jgi:hypothetical protein